MNELSELSTGSDTNLSSIIIVEQLPIITAKLKEVKLQILCKISDIASLVVTEESKQMAKKARADLKQDFELLEERRKVVKALVLEPYNAFEEIYKSEIAILYKNADIEIKNKIDAIENAQIEEKTEISKAYFGEYSESLNINFLTFERGNFKINLGISQKALKQIPKDFLDGINKDLKTIDTMEFKEEVLFEYKKSLDLNNAIFEVNSRHKEIEVIKAEITAKKEIDTQEEKTVKAVFDCISAPKEVEKEITLTFKVTGTKWQLIAVREFMKDRGIKYE